MRLKMTLNKYWKIVNPEMSKSQIRGILDNLENLDSIKVITKKAKEDNDALRDTANECLNMLEETNKKVDKTIMYYQESVKILVDILNQIYAVQQKKKYKALDDVLNENFGRAQYATNLLETMVYMWPEFFNEEEDDETKV